MSKKYVYSFSEGDGRNKHLLGGKGANLCEMTQIGLNVPPGFVITTEACLEYLDRKELPSGLLEEVGEHIRRLEEKPESASAAKTIRSWSRSGRARPCLCPA